MANRHSHRFRAIAAERRVAAVPGPARASVVVPAHDEETSLVRCLASVLSDGVPLDIVVVTNGCTDRTADAARSFPVHVLDMPTPDKAAALNVGDSEVDVMPRLYIDADVQLLPGSVSALVRALSGDLPRLAVPFRQFDLMAASWVVRAYYRAWQRLQEVRGDLLGCGVYAVNAAGRARWTTFPDGVADDYHVHTRFAPAERLRVVGAVAVIRPPRTVRALLNVRTRVVAGNVEHVAHHGRLVRGRPNWGVLLHDPAAIAALPVYVLVTLIAKRRARAALTDGSIAWNRDASGRAL